MGPLKALLDTCTLIWLASDPGWLGTDAARAIDEADDLFLSDVSVWEIGLKWAAGKLTLPVPPRSWLRGQGIAWSLAPVPITREHLLRSFELPALHRDPFDRLLVAQEIMEDMTLLTPDPAIAAYPVPVLW